MKKQMEQDNCQTKISVIIPVFNTKECLPRCLTSVLMNTYRNLEKSVLMMAVPWKCRNFGRGSTCKTFFSV